MNEKELTTTEAAYEADVQRILGTMPERRKANSQADWLDGLSQRDRHLIVAEIFHAEVCNGGFAQWVENGYHHELLPSLLLVLRRMEGKVLEGYRQDLLSLVSRAASIVANDTPDEPDAGCLSDDAYEALGSLDSRYYEFSDAWKANCTQYFLEWR